MNLHQGQPPSPRKPEHFRTPYMTCDKLRGQSVFGLSLCVLATAAALDADHDACAPPIPGTRLLQVEVSLVVAVAPSATVFVDQVETWPS